MPSSSTGRGRVATSVPSSRPRSRPRTRLLLYTWLADAGHEHAAGSLRGDPTLLLPPSLPASRFPLPVSLFRHLVDHGLAQHAGFGGLFGTAWPGRAVGQARRTGVAWPDDTPGPTVRGRVSHLLIYTIPLPLLSADAHASVVSYHRHAYPIDLLFFSFFSF